MKIKIYQNYRIQLKELLKKKFTALNSYMGKEEKSQINDLTFHIMNLIKKRKQNAKEAEKEILNIGGEINERKSER